MPGCFHYFKGDKEFLVLGQIYKEEQRKGRFSGGEYTGEKEGRKCNNLFKINLKCLKI